MGKGKSLTVSGGFGRITGAGGKIGERIMFFNHVRGKYQLIQGSRRMKKKGFTLIELLVVISIIALLLAILMPALAKVKLKAASVVCLTNVKNLSLGWFMYQENSDGWIMGCNMNATLNGTRVGWIGAPRNESGTTLTYWSTSPVTDEDEIRGIKWGVLWPYVEAPDAFNCPVDKVKSLYDGGEKLVTYAVPYALNSSPGSSTTPQIRKYGQLSRPSSRYIFVETAETRNYTLLGHWVFATPETTNDSSYGWWGPMAVNHGDSSTLGFADGHSENHVWRDSYTKERVEKLIKQGGGTYGQTYPGDLPEFPIEMVTDLNYMVKGWPYHP